MQKLVYPLLVCILLLSAEGFCQQPEPAPFIRWKQLAPVPDSFGFAGSFAGISHQALVVASGANFPDGGAPWTGSQKVWSDKIFVLDKPGGRWKVAGKLPQPLGYGVSVTWHNSVICIGGSNAGGHYASVFSITFNGTGITIEQMPALPEPLANCTGAMLGNTVYIAGGLLSPASATAAKVFWALDLSDPGKRKWKALQTWPGPPRMLAVAGVHGKSFFFFSGTDITTVGGQPQRVYLQDAYQFTPAKGWNKIADLPYPVVAAPGPAYSAGGSLMIFGGDDGTLAAQASVLKADHPGFSDKVLLYNTRTGQWSSPGKIMTDIREDAAANPNGSVWMPVTTPLVTWGKNLVFPGGEVRPAVRTPKVIMAYPPFKQTAANSHGVPK